MVVSLSSTLCSPPGAAALLSLHLCLIPLYIKWVYMLLLPLRAKQPLQSQLIITLPTEFQFLRQHHPPNYSNAPHGCCAELTADPPSPGPPLRQAT